MDPTESFVLVISTGGTIASTADASGARVPTLDCAALVARAGVRTPVRTTDAVSLDSSAMSLAEVDMLRELVRASLADAHVTGIVITHGTDSMADTALALDLVHDDPRPVVLTGAQRPADSDAPDGPANLRGAIAAAADPTQRDRGVLVHFGGDTLPARGLYKADTEALRAFALTSPEPLPRPAAVAAAPLAGARVPVLAAWPGADSELADALVDQRPDGIVVAGLGSGNVSTTMGQALARALERGIEVVISTAVARGEVSLAYGGEGGGATLADLGAYSAGFLRPGQARMALATALATGTDPARLLGA